MLSCRPAAGRWTRTLRRRGSEAFVAELPAWVAWWNTENVMPALKGRTQLQAWLEDPTPLTTVPAADPRLLMLEDDGRTRKITTKGVAWRGPPQPPGRGSAARRAGGQRRRPPPHAAAERR